MRKEIIRLLTRLSLLGFIQHEVHENESPGENELRPIKS